MLIPTLRAMVALGLLAGLAACDTPAQGFAAGAAAGAVAAEVTDNEPIIGAVVGGAAGAAISEANCRQQGLCP